MTDLFMTVPGGSDPFDKNNLRTAGETSWNTVMTRSGENPETWRRYVSSSALLSSQQYTFTSEFYGYGVYKGSETLQALGSGTTYNGKNYAGIPLEKFCAGTAL